MNHVTVLTGLKWSNTGNFKLLSIFQSSVTRTLIEIYSKYSVIQGQGTIDYQGRRREMVFGKASERKRMTFNLDLKV